MGLTLVLIEGEEDDSAIVVEIFVLQERDQPEVQPVSDEVDGRVVALSIRADVRLEIQ